MAGAAHRRDAVGARREELPMRRPILCGLDESTEALAAARLADALARCLDARLVLVHAIVPVYANDGWAVLAPVPQNALDDTPERERRHGEALLERIVGQLHLSDDTQTNLLVGHAGTALLESAGAADAAAVVVGARGRGRIHRAVLGSVSGRVAGSAPCPVVIAPHDMEIDVPLATGPIVCGVDGSEHAEHGARVAAALAERLGRELVLVHVLQTGLVLDEVVRREGWETLTSVAKRIGVPARLSAEMPTDTTASALSERARTEGAACLVIGSRGRGPVRAALLGSVSAGVAAQAQCPVVVVPPGAPPIVDRENPRARAAHTPHT
jgi:nucleotide-binding universal stress UspA family protein